MNLASQILGSLLIIVGVVLLLRPQVVSWLSDQTNLPAARRSAQRGNDRILREYAKRVTQLRIAMAGFFMLVGTLLVAGAF
jgi:hypothetical protein